MFFRPLEMEVQEMKLMEESGLVKLRSQADTFSHIDNMTVFGEPVN